MYFIAYNQGRKLCDGYGPSVEAIVNQFPGTFELEGTLGDEQKWTDKSKLASTVVVYIRPRK